MSTLLLLLLTRISHVGRSLTRSRLPSVAMYSTAPIHSTDHKFNVQVGATLQLSLPKVDVDVDVHTGDNMEEIDVKAWWNLNGSLVPSMDAIAQQSINRVYVNLGSEESRTCLQRLQVVMPERWCSLLIESGKGLVTIGNMKEANLSVMTCGGDVTLGEVRGNEVVIKSSGGSVTAALITAALELDTGGGALSLKKVVGNSVQIDTGGGDMVIGSAYGQDLKLLSRGGSIQFKHMQVQDFGHVSSNGGHVRIDGLDGSVKICSRGGNVRLQLLANAKEVNIDAESGEIALYASPEHDMTVEHAEKRDGNDATRAADNNANKRGEVSKLPRVEQPGCRVYITGGGKVAVTKRSWLEAVMGCAKAA